ncbi:MAG TPA: hypothetical protein VFV19_14370 [Candidatus Polarisedimenticolaceae bacterium]|nr:hypothetical protein [Candidatus Polarisedimenticolaceae bacterium]
MRALAAALALAAAVSCAGRHPAASMPPGTGPLVGLYRASIADPEGRVRKLKLLLWAQAPDRIHAELLGPVGGVRLTVDAGPGAAAVIDHESAIAYAGVPSPDDVRRLVGVPLAVPALVEALLSGTKPDGLRVERVGAPGLPERFTVAGGGGTLTLELVHLTRGSDAAAALGTGAPPPAMTVRPLEEWEAAER